VDGVAAGERTEFEGRADMGGADLTGFVRHRDRGVHIGQSAASSVTAIGGRAARAAGTTAANTPGHDGQHGDELQHAEVERAPPTVRRSYREMSADHVVAAVADLPGARRRPSPSTGPTGGPSAATS
jgi:hypothetical protein